MKGIANYPRSASIIIILVVIVFMLTILIDNQKREAAVIKNADEQQFAGSAVCANCHKKIYDSHILTAHYLTSKPALEEYIKGSFETGKNTFAYTDSVKIVMERDINFYQVEYVNGIAKRNRRFDIAIGSGTKGQSYLNWRKQSLFQLPLTYFTAANQWSNSPGYPNRVLFNRPITSRCLECHTTFVKKTSAPDIIPEKFDHNQIIYGVDCEKCHGPAEKHVQFQSENPKETKGRYIIGPAALSRQQNLDMCALCHGGRLSKTRPSFQFMPGDKLSDFFLMDTALKDAKDIDVHGNQLGLLAASKCFKKSQITCTSCHNTHENERANTALFAQRCMTCHSESHGNFCKISNLSGPTIIQNCINCHMPEQSSKTIAVLLQGAKTPASAIMRTHFIKIYPEETKKVLAFIKRNSD